MTLSAVQENARDLLYTVVASYHVLVDKLAIGTAPASEWLRLLEDVAGATSSGPRTIDVLREAAERALAADFAIDLCKRPDPEREISAKRTGR